MQHRLAVLFHRLGPYHWARLTAAAKEFDLVAIEESADTPRYAWDKVTGDAGFLRVTLFKSGEGEAVQTREMRSRMHAALSSVAPTVVAIPGWSNPGALAALQWSRANHVPVIVMSESTALDSPRRWWKESIKRRLIPLFPAALVGGTAHRNYLMQLGMPDASIFRGYDAVDNRYFFEGAEAARRHAGALRTELNLPDYYFLASNRFLTQKNLPFLLEAYASYRKLAGQVAWSLVLLGDGPLKAELLARRAALGLDEHVSMPGFKQYPELPRYYGLAGAFVHASIIEPWGLVVNEAMAAGLPVLVSQRCGCASDLVCEGRNGFTFNPAEPAELGALMLAVSNAPAEQRSAWGEAGRHIIEAWSTERFATGMRDAAQIATASLPAKATWLAELLLHAMVR